MSNMKKTDDFFAKIEAAGLTKAFEKMAGIAYDTLGCYLEDLIDDAVFEMEKPKCRIRYCEKDQDGDECYIFETRQNDEEEYGLTASYRLIDDRISYQALTQVREMVRLGYDIHFA